MRTENGISTIDVVALVVILVAAYFGYQYFTVYKQPTNLINKEFLCLRTGGVPAFQNPHMLAEYLRLNSASARFAAPDKAIENEAKREAVNSSGLVDLDAYTANSSTIEKRSPLAVRVLDDYTDEKGFLLLRVKVLNKSHQGETWYIPADKLNPLMNVTGFADKAVKVHKPGVDDVIESQRGTKLFQKLDKASENNR